MSAIARQGFEESNPLTDLPRNHFGAILADPPWHFETWSPNGRDRSPDKHYQTMRLADIAALDVRSIARANCVLFLWACWPTLPDAFKVIEAWGFEYKSCAFDWTKANNTQPDFFQDELPARIGCGFWTRANTEPCLLATRGKPKRLNADVRQAIIAPRREHSRKPEEIYRGIERLVAGPYLELFARETRPGWTTWGNEKTKFDSNRSEAAA